jgi:cytidylate kinase
VSNVITIDGPTSSGKSSVGLLFSQKIGYQFIDTGRIYRAGALYILRHGVPIENEDRVADVFKNLNIRFEMVGEKQKLFLDDEDVTPYLHSPEITSIVPVVAAHAKAREFAKALQRKIGSAQDTVMVGRDIGSEIFPDAKLKFFLTASPDVRADRRLKQVQKVNPEITKEEILEDMLKRDDADSTREASPFRKPDDAVIVDTTYLTTEESVNKMLELFNQVFK